ncbi:MAG TPA: hypothetical protein VGX00_07250 [Thermoplasmata archaeon]|nr:hypothetical protein [Thermoplasmata archaeon]
MRKGLFAGGIAVVILGALLVGVAFLLASSSLTIPNPSTNQALEFSPNFIGSGTVTVSWSGATSQFRFHISQCENSACSSLSQAPVANGAGASGSVSFGASGGQTFVVLPTGNANAVPVTVALSGGLTPLLLIGIIVLVLGAVVALLGYRAKAKPKVEYEDDAAPQREMFRVSATPFTGVQQGPAATASSASPQYRPEAPENSGPVYFQPAEGQESYGSNAPATPAAPSGGARPPIKCSSCGAMNEPWITNCRNCRRPLSSTGT